MSTPKDIIKVVALAFLAAISTELIARYFTRSDMIDDAATKTELLNTKTEMYEDINILKKDLINYTDEELKEHEEREDATYKMLVKYLDQRFDDMEKLIDTKM